MLQLFYKMKIEAMYIVQEFLLRLQSKNYVMFQLDLIKTVRRDMFMFKHVFCFNKN